MIDQTIQPVLDKLMAERGLSFAQLENRLHTLSLRDDLKLALSSGASPARRLAAARRVSAYLAGDRLSGPGIVVFLPGNSRTPISDNSGENPGHEPHPQIFFYEPQQEIEL